MIAAYFAALILVAVVSSLPSCSKKNGPEPDPDAPPPPTPNVDATVEPEGSPCERMCANFDRLGCRGKVSGRRLADPTPGGTTCVESCEQIEAADGISVNPECQARAETCEAADRCDD